MEQSIVLNLPTLHHSGTYQDYEYTQVHRLSYTQLTPTMANYHFIFSNVTSTH